MEKRTRAACIIIYNGKLITIYREKIVNGKLKKYYVIPGGGVEKGETILEAAKREIMEELGIEIEVTDKYFYLEKEDAKEYFYIAKYVLGKIGSGTGPEFTNRNVEKYGTYEVKVVDVSEVKNINLMPPEVKEYILNQLNNNNIM